MASRKAPYSNRLIPVATFNVCAVDNLTLDDICDLYTRKDCGKVVAYRLDKFVHHLKVTHNMTLVDYCRRYSVYDWPKCPIKGSDVGYRVDGKGVHLATYAQGAIDPSLPANQAFYTRMREERRGEGNPMWGKASWNKGLTTDDPRVAAMIAKGVTSRGPATAEQREAQRQRLAALIAERGPLHAMPHSEETKEKARLNTARLWAQGVFKRTSSIHLKMREFLKSLPLKQPFVEEHQVKWFSMDFAFPALKLAIEVQGSYYHVDPRLYPEGPVDAIQRRNWGRDKAKRITCCDREGWTILEAWEPEINDGSFKDDIACKLKQYGLLD